MSPVPTVAARRVFRPVVLTVVEMVAGLDVLFRIWREDDRDVLRTVELASGAVREQLDGG